MARDPSPAITEPAANAKRNASAWSSKYRMTCPDIMIPPNVNYFPSPLKDLGRAMRDQHEASGTFHDCRGAGPWSEVLFLVRGYRKCMAEGDLTMKMVGTGRFELPTPRTPSECSTRLSHVPTRKEPAVNVSTADRVNSKILPPASHFGSFGWIFIYRWQGQGRGFNLGANWKSTGVVICTRSFMRVGPPLFGSVL